jgi:group I intron endonuclease
MDESYGIIYKATNVINEKVYIGQTIQTLHSRRTKHESNSRKERPLYHFGKALKKHGLDNFKWEIVMSCNNREELNDMERQCVITFDSHKSGYNETLGGEGSCGRKQSEATKRLISLKKTGIPLSKEHREKLSLMRRGVKKSRGHVDNVAYAKSQFWQVVHPDNKIEIIRNLSLFCREHNISDRGMWLVANGYRTHHKSYKCKKIQGGYTR